MDTRRKPIKLLLIDDEVEFLKSTERALSRRGFEIDTATDGRAGLDLLAQRFFDVVLLDLKMPGLSGEQVFFEIRLRWPGTAVVLLTGHGTVDHAFTIAREGAYDYIAKPCEVERLVTILRGAGANAQAAAQVDTHDSIRVLLVVDEAPTLSEMAHALRREGMVVSEVSEVSSALDRVGRELFHIAVVSESVAATTGLEIVRQIKNADPLVETIVLSAQPSLDQAVHAMKRGAVDYLTQPVSADVLSGAIREAYRRNRERFDQDRERRVRAILDKSPD